MSNFAIIRSDFLVDSKFFNLNEIVMRQIHIPFLLFFLFLFSVSCVGDSPKTNPDISNTVLVYLAADNSLSGMSTYNIEQMMVGMERCDAAANLLVYVDNRSKPCLFLIKRDSKGKVHKTLLKEYEEHNSASKEVMRGVIEEVFALYPANHKGLVLWSHGLNWFPVGYYGGAAPASFREGVSAIKRSFGQDFVNGKSIEMSLTDLVEAIPDLDLSFIAFDACYMGSVEVAYALRNKAKQLIASPTEVLEDGFPYKEIMHYMLTGAPQTSSIAQSFFSLYNGQYGLHRSATISVINLSVMDELAAWTKRNLPLLNRSFNVSDLQHFDRFSNRYQFDFCQLYEVGLDPSVASVRIGELSDLWRRLVSFKAATPYFMCNNDGAAYSGGFHINHFCGLSTYFEFPTYTYLNGEYIKTEWYRATR